MIHCMLIAGMRFMVADSIVSSLLFSRRSYTRIDTEWPTKGVLHYESTYRAIARGNRNPAYSPHVLCGPLLCPVSSCDFQSSCSQFGIPIISSPASISTSILHHEHKALLRSNHAQILSQEHGSVLRVRILNMARRCNWLQRGFPNQVA